METQLKLAMMNDELGQARTSKKEFLDKIESIIPWDKFIEIIEPCYYKGERGNKPYPLELIGEGRDDRVFDHEKKNYSDFTEKGIEISKILSEGGIIEKYILDCQMESTSKILGQTIAFHAENALINLAKLSNIGIHNSQVGHGFPKQAMTVDEIDAFFCNDSITYDIFDPADKVLVYRFPYSNQTLFNAIDSETKIKDFFLSNQIVTKEGRELPLYICVVYRSIFRKIYRISSNLEVIPPQKEKGKTRYKVNIVTIESADKYTEFLGRSFGSLASPHGNTSPIYTYDPK